MSKITLGQIGLGHWGPNLFRNFYEHEAVHFALVADIDPAKLDKIKQYHVDKTVDCDRVLAPGNGIDAVVISTPVLTHFAIAKKALLAGKHIFLEKPMTGSVKESEELVKLAIDKGVTIMVGHVFLYNTGIRYVKRMIDSGELGKIYFIHGQRTNLGPIRQDVNALWDLASHDISIFDYWLGRRPHRVSACGSHVLNDRLEDVVNANFFYPGNVCCQILASWLHPKKVRQITVVGDKKMVVWDDMSPTEPVRIYDKSVHHLEPAEQVEGTFSEFNFMIQEGDLLIPKIRGGEPLKKECHHFIDCLLKNERPLSDGKNGLDVVKSLDAASCSMANDGQSVALDSCR